jgi:hypothetical protein
MSKLIKFIPNVRPGLEEYLKYVDIPKPSKQFIPEWWKSQELTTNGKDINSIPKFSFKACVPFLDSLTMGYMIYTQQDIHVSYVDESPFLRWKMEPAPVILREDSQNLPVPEGHNNSHFAWVFNCAIEMPPGYSVLITHPLNRFDLPFTTLSGIVDQGNPWGGQFTFWIKDRFTGIIPKGTPLAQIIPFKRENWKSEKADHLISLAQKKSYESNTVFGGYYKKFLHKKKKFE